MAAFAFQLNCLSLSMSGADTKKCPEWNYILFTGCRPFLPKGRARSFKFEELMRYAGHNTGNFLIGSAVKTVVSQKLGDGCYIAEYLDLEEFSLLSSDYVNSKYKAVFYAGANFINPSIDLGFLANIVSMLKIPFIIMGAGAQSDNEDTPNHVPDGTVTFLRAASEKASSIGVRGTYTQECLVNLGIRNVTVTGCPSFTLIDPDLVLRNFDTVENSGNLKFAFSVKRDELNSPHRHGLQKIHQNLMKTALRNGNGFYIVQSNYSEAVIAHSHALKRDHVNDIASYFSTSEEVVREFLRCNMKIFFEFEGWRDLCSEMQFSTGSRFHGSVMSLIAGIPAVVVTHDSRTSELCRFTGIPQVHVSELDGDEVLPELASKFDGASFCTAHQRAMKSFDSFLDQVCADIRLE